MKLLMFFKDKNMRRQQLFRKRADNSFIVIKERKHIMFGFGKDLNLEDKPRGRLLEIVKELQRNSSPGSKRRQLNDYQKNLKRIAWEKLASTVH